MQYNFIYEKKRYLYDLSSGEIFEYSKLEKELIPFMQKMSKSLPSACPSGLRYSLAKYEVSEIYAAYDRLFSLIDTKKLVFTDPSSITDCAALKISGVDRAFLKKVIIMVVNNVPTIESFKIISDTEDEADAFIEEAKELFSFIAYKKN